VVFDMSQAVQKKPRQVRPLAQRLAEVKDKQAALKRAYKDQAEAEERAALTHVGATLVRAHVAGEFPMFGPLLHQAKATAADPATFSAAIERLRERNAKAFERKAARQPNERLERLQAVIDTKISAWYAAPVDSKKSITGDLQTLVADWEAISGQRHPAREKHALAIGALR